MRFGKPIEELTSDVLDDLVKDEVPEDRDLDYKELLPDDKPDSHREFLYDASSFANAVGGVLIFGIREKRDTAGHGTGEPEQVLGLPGLNTDETIRRLEGMLRDGIEPRIPGIRFPIFRLNEAPPALVMSIPRSSAGPHMVKYRGMSRFYTRDSRGKVEMDYHQIRASFEASLSLIAHARRFREDRIKKIALGSALPTVLNGRARSVLHLIPLSTDSLDPPDILRVRRNIDLLPPPGWRSLTSSGERLNLDGYARTAGQISYVQIFRSGAIEAVDSALLNHAAQGIPWPDLEKELLEQMRRYLRCLQTLNLDPPISVAVTLVNVPDYSIVGSGFQSFRTQQLDREILAIPETIADSYSIDAPRLMRPIFDILWQSCGRDRSDSYDEKGNCILKLED
jgi:Putative DNA-binding domain